MNKQEPSLKLFFLLTFFFSFFFFLYVVEYGVVDDFGGWVLNPEVARLSTGDTKSPNVREKEVDSVAEIGSFLEEKAGGACPGGLVDPVVVVDVDAAASSPLPLLLDRASNVRLTHSSNVAVVEWFKLEESMLFTYMTKGVYGLLVEGAKKGLVVMSVLVPTNRMGMDGYVALRLVLLFCLLPLNKDP